MSRPVKVTFHEHAGQWNDRAYTRRLTPDEDGGYTASIQEFPGCFADGDTADQALENLMAAAASWVAAQEDLGQEIPPPFAAHNFSGRIALRIPRSLHKQAAELASSEGVSLNQVLTSAISAYVTQKSLACKLKKELQSLADSVVRISSGTLKLHNVSNAYAIGRPVLDLTKTSSQMITIPALVHANTREKARV